MNIRLLNFRSLLNHIPYCGIYEKFHLFEDYYLYNIPINKEILVVIFKGNTLYYAMNDVKSPSHYCLESMMEYIHENNCLTNVPTNNYKYSSIESLYKRYITKFSIENDIRRFIYRDEKKITKYNYVCVFFNEKILSVIGTDFNFNNNRLINCYNLPDDSEILYEIQTINKIDLDDVYLMMNRLDLTLLTSDNH